MFFRSQQFVVNSMGEVEIQTETYRHHPSALAASRSHQRESILDSGGRVNTVRYADGPEAGWPGVRVPQRNWHMEAFFEACEQAEEFRDRRYRNYLMREGSSREIFEYFYN